MRNIDLNSGEWIIIGDNNIIHKSVFLDLNKLEIGKNNLIYPNCVIGLCGFIRDESVKTSKVIIGDDNIIGTNVSIMTGSVTDTIIGNNNLIMNYVNIGHNVVIGNDNEIGVRSTIAGYANIGDNNRIKINCNIRNRCIIGDYNLIGMGSNVVSNIDSDNIIYGNPANKVGDVNRW